MATSVTVRISGKFHCLHEADAVLQSGNLHLNVIADAYTPEIEAALEPFVYELVGELHQRSLMAKKLTVTLVLAKYKGSVSAEHGIGVHKTHALHYTKSATSIEWMKKVKKLFDPKGIMNPGKVLV
jgi:FAD/FMN-containing dehydrogenase